MPVSGSRPNILWFDSLEASLQLAGGKGANLARLAQAGYPVPGGFIIATLGYRAYCDANSVLPDIRSILAETRLDDPASLENTSERIRRFFRSAYMPASLADEIKTAYRQIGEPPVAVRSSATAEDLPGISFAGQQDTFLNIQGEKALIEAVASCWSSLWTARAIGYRARQGLSQDEIYLAVVVQQMVDSEVSGVLFSANPLTGLRSETVIDATLGLGEALVSGKVEPDQYVVDRDNGVIRSKQIGAKALAIHSAAGGGVTETVQDASQRQALSDDQIMQLATLGQRVAEFYQFPQDIEWACVGGSIYLLQSRPITSLYPTPDGMPANPLRVMFSFGAVQGMLEPVSPLGIDIFRKVAERVGRFWKYNLTYETQQVFCAAGFRLWVNITALLRHGVGRKIVLVALPLVEPGTSDALKQILADPDLSVTSRRFSPAAMKRLIKTAAAILPHVIKNIHAPEKRAMYIDSMVEAVLAHINELFKCQYTGLERLQYILVNFDKIFDQLGRAAPAFLSGVIAPMASFNLLYQLMRRLPVADEDQQINWMDQVMLVTRGAFNNPTTEMDLALWSLAKCIKQTPETAAHLLQIPADQLAEEFQARRLPAPVQEAINAFLQRYGMRGVGEIDIYSQRWVEDPRHVFEVIKSYLEITDENLAPDAVFKRSAEQAEQTVEVLASQARRAPLGWLKARLVRFLARRIRVLIGLRELPKFYIVRLLGILRREFLACGAELVAAGMLAQPDDFFFLSLKDLRAFARQEPGDWTGIIAANRAGYQFEHQRRQIPRLLLSDGRAFYEGVSTPASANHDSIYGNPVSPGVVEGAAKIILNPRTERLNSGEILVCPGTDPAWTPLFLAAGGLVMEVGGMMTHGAVVAREYGIPAVVGVHQATTRLKTGQRIRVNGSTGEITLLESLIAG